MRTVESVRSTRVSTSVRFSASPSPSSLRRSASARQTSPGVGRLAVDAIFSRDYPLVQAIVAMLATLFVVINLVMDMLYTYLDPRIVLVRGRR